MEVAVAGGPELRELLEELVVRARSIEAKVGAVEYRLRKAIGRADRAANDRREEAARIIG